MLKIEDKPALRRFYDTKLQAIHRAYGELHDKITTNEVNAENAIKKLKRLDKKLSDYKKLLKA